MLEHKIDHSKYELNEEILIIEDGVVMRGHRNALWVSVIISILSLLFFVLLDGTPFEKLANASLAVMGSAIVAMIIEVCNYTDAKNKNLFDFYQITVTFHNKLQYISKQYDNEHMSDLINAFATEDNMTIYSNHYDCALFLPFIEKLSGKFRNKQAVYDHVAKMIGLCTHYRDIDSISLFWEDKILEIKKAFDQYMCNVREPLVYLRDVLKIK